MSPDSNSRIVREVDLRLAELEPLLREYEQLKAVRQVLTEHHNAAPGPRRTRRASGSPAIRGRRTPRGANREAILAFVRTHPAASVTQIAQATGIARPTLHTTVSVLKRAGVLRSDGEGVSLAQTPPTRARTTSRRRTTARTTARRAARPRRASSSPAANSAAPSAPTTATQSTAGDPTATAPAAD